MQPTISLQRPRKVTVVQSIIEQITREIQTGRLRVGDKLPSERQLIEMLQVSRSSVREALQGLAMMGVIESRAGQGSFVSPRAGLSARDPSSPLLPEVLQRTMLLSLIEARRTIEGTVAHLAAERATEAALERLRAAFEAYRQHEEQGAAADVPPAFHHLFHIALAEMTGNAFFVLVVETLLHAVPPSLRESEFVAGGPTEQLSHLAAEIELHRVILTAVEQRDGPAAQRAVHDHMDVELRLVQDAFLDP